jgi:hypothetical protein
MISPKINYELLILWRGGYRFKWQVSDLDGTVKDVGNATSVTKARCAGENALAQLIQLSSKNSLR